MADGVGLGDHRPRPGVEVDAGGVAEVLDHHHPAGKVAGPGVHHAHALGAHAQLRPCDARSTPALRKFIAGEPMRPATKRLAEWL